MHLLHYIPVFCESLVGWRLPGKARTHRDSSFGFAVLYSPHRMQSFLMLRVANQALKTKPSNSSVGGASESQAWKEFSITGIRSLQSRSRTHQQDPKFLDTSPACFACYHRPYISSRTGSFREPVCWRALDFGMLISTSTTPSSLSAPKSMLPLLPSFISPRQARSSLDHHRLKWGLG